MKRNVFAAIGLLAAWFGCGQTGFAQLSLPLQQPIVGARMPALSPDGKQLAFVYRGDIWITTDKGGRATPLTQHIETDAYPLFSPDGRWIAFGSKRSLCERMRGRGRLSTLSTPSLKCKTAMAGINSAGRC